MAPACQLGIGGMPNTVGSMIAQSDLKDLGVHTEMYVDGVCRHGHGGQDHRRRASGLTGASQVYAFGCRQPKAVRLYRQQPGLLRRLP